MIRKSILFISLLFWCVSLFSQGVNDCIKSEEVERVMMVSAFNDLNAHIYFSVCFIDEGIIVIRIYRKFKKGGEIVEEEKIRKQGHKLLLVNATHAIYDIISPAPEPPLDQAAEIIDTLSFQYKAIKNVSWINRSIIFTVGFQYRKNNKRLQTEEAEIEFVLPDYSEQARVTDDGTLGDTVLSDSVEIKDAELVKDLDQPERVDENERRVRSSQSSAKDIESNSCMDSLRYYFHQIFSLYNRIERYNDLDDSDKQFFRTKLGIYTTLFYSFYSDCDTKGVEQLKNEFDQLSNFIFDKTKEVSLPDDQVSDLDLDSDDEITDESNNSFVFKDLLLYVFGILLLILVILYIYPKIKKKLK